MDGPHEHLHLGAPREREKVVTQGIDSEDLSLSLQSSGVVATRGQCKRPGPNEHSNMSLEPGPLCLFEFFIKRDEAPRAPSSHWVESCVIRSVSRSLRHYLYRASIQGKGFSRSIPASYLLRIPLALAFSASILPPPARPPTSHAHIPLSPG